MGDIEIKRGYEILPENKLRFWLRLTNSSSAALSDVEVILDWNKTLFEIEGGTSPIKNLGTIPPYLPRTAEYILKPLSCVHRETIGATVRYKDHTWKRHTLDMRPKEIHCVLDNIKVNNSFKAETSKNLTSEGIDFVLIPAGEFMMGSKEYIDEQPVHRVTIEKSFYLGKYPVTQKQWYEFMGSNPSSFKGDNQPVECVSWIDAQKFINKLNEIVGSDKYRLPSEAEWEYACRAGTVTRYSFGDDISKLSDYAWYDENWCEGNLSGGSQSVGQKKPNIWGLHDMHGNVCEWVQDVYHTSYKGAPSDGSAWESEGSPSRVCRGGSFLDNERLCRTANRLRYDSNLCGGLLGFRLLREL